jgi:quercetin dioxygenase-like cupin family protein
VEIAHVTEGELTLTVEDAEYRVPAGASVTFEANAPHAYGNRGEVPTRFVLAVSVPPVP